MVSQQTMGHSRLNLSAVRAASVLLLAAISSALDPGGAIAQGPLRRPTAPLAGPPTSIVSPDGVLALDVDPAALALLEGSGLLYVRSDAGSDDAIVERGDRVFMGGGLPFGLGAGFAAGRVRPNASTGREDYGQASVGLAFAPGRSFAIGTALRFYGSQDPLVGGLTTYDMSVTMRPSPRIGLALVGHDLFGPLELGGAEDLPASFLLALAVRPFGTDAMTFEVAGAADTDGGWGVRGFADVRVPYVGRARVQVEADDLRNSNPDVRVLAGLAVDWGHLTVEGGVIHGDGVEDGPGWYVAAGLHGGARTEGIPVPRYAMDIEVEGLGARGLLGLLGKLDRALHDPQVGGVLLRLRSTSMGLAYAQEIRQMLRALEDAGKPTVCFVENASGSEIYACSAATRTLADPAGTVRLLGPSMDIILLGDLLRNAGIRADFVRIGEYKSAVEQLTNAQMSAPARRQREIFLDDIYRRMLADFAGDRSGTLEEAAALVDQGPYTVGEALEAGLVSATADELTLDRSLGDALGGLRRREQPLRDGSGTWGVGKRIGVVVIDGSIVDGENVDIPILEIHQSGGRTVAQAIERMGRDPSVGAIVLRVDSPGGSVLASDQIWRAVMRARERKPVIATMGSVAASGGYYVSSAASEIYADPATLTGSIGIFFGKVDVAPLAERIGVHVEQLARGRNAGADSLYRPFTADERAALTEKIRTYYRDFLARVAEGRDMTVQDVDRLGRGRVYTGDTALRLGLVDHLGGFGAALARARELAGVGPDADVVVLPGRPGGLLDYVLAGTSGGVFGFGGDEGAFAEVDAASLPADRAPLAPGMRLALEAAMAVRAAEPGAPLALLPAFANLQ